MAAWTVPELNGPSGRLVIVRVLRRDAVFHEIAEGLLASDGFGQLKIFAKANGGEGCHIRASFVDQFPVGTGKPPVSQVLAAQRLLDFLQPLLARDRAFHGLRDQSAFGEFLVQPNPREWR